MIGIAKDKTRKSGLEMLKFLQRSDIQLSSSSNILRLIQYIRDESHRFAIKKHRSRRQKNMKVSILDEIPGVGIIKKKKLLQHIGGLQELEKASISDIHRVPGISLKLAEEIYNFLR